MVTCTNQLTDTNRNSKTTQQTYPYVSDMSVAFQTYYPNNFAKKTKKAATPPG